MTITPSQRVRVPASVLVSDMGGEAVLLNLDSETYFGLDDVGARMWAVLTQSASLEAAVLLLLEEFDVAEGVLREDLLRFVEQLDSQGLIALEPAADG